MTYVPTDLSGSSALMGKTVAGPAPRVERNRSISDQPMIAANPALTRVNGGAKAGSNNNALIAGVGVVALLALGGGTWALTHRAAPSTATPAAAPATPLVTEPSVSTPVSTSNAAVSPIAAKPVADERALTSTRAAPPIRSLRAPASRSAALPYATPSAAPPNTSTNLTPQPQAVTPPVISPAPEAVTPAAPTTLDATPAAPAPTAT